MCGHVSDARSRSRSEAKSRVRRWPAAARSACRRNRVCSQRPALLKNWKRLRAKKRSGVGNSKDNTANAPVGKDPLWEIKVLRNQWDDVLKNGPTDASGKRYGMPIEQAKQEVLKQLASQKAEGRRAVGRRRVCEKISQILASAVVSRAALCCLLLSAALLPSHARPARSAATELAALWWAIESGPDFDGIAAGC